MCVNDCRNPKNIKMNCSIAALKNGIPFAIKISLENGYLVVEKNGDKYSVLISSLQQVLSFFK